MPLDTIITRALENAEILIISYGCSFPAGSEGSLCTGTKAEGEGQEATGVFLDKSANAKK